MSKQFVLAQCSRQTADITDAELWPLKGIMELVPKCNLTSCMLDIHCIIVISETVNCSCSYANYNATKFETLKQTK